MPYTNIHRLVNIIDETSVSLEDGGATISYHGGGTFQVRYPGQLRLSKFAKYRIRFWFADPQGADGQWVWTDKSFPVTLQILTPRGYPHHSDHISLDDLAEYRDQRGTSRGEWSYEVSGQTTE